MLLRLADGPHAEEQGHIIRTLRSSLGSRLRTIRLLRVCVQHLGLLKAKLAKLKREIINPKSSGGGKPGEGALSPRRTPTPRSD
jgi:hypothetical protein